MRRILIAIMLLCLMPSLSFGASEDVYVRQDVFDAKMEALFNRFHGEIMELRSEIKGELDGLRTEMRTEIGKVRTELADFKTEVKTEFGEVRGDIKALNARMYGFEKQVEYFGNFPYWMLVLFGAILLLPFFNKWWETRAERKQNSQPLVTLEDVRRLIEENNAKLASTFQMQMKGSI